MQDRYREHGVVVVGVTRAGRDDVEEFRLVRGVTYPLLANAEADLKAFGVRMILGTEAYLVNPDGRVLARGIDEVDARLASEFGS